MSKYKDIAIQIIRPIVSVFIALLIGAIVLLAMDANPITVYSTLFNSAFGNSTAIIETLQRATPYIYGGLAFAMAAHAGLFNIGIEGQMYVGAMFATIIGFSFTNLPAVIHLPLAILAGIFGGVLWALIPGLLKVYRGVSEVVSTVMMNYVAYAFTAYLTVHIFLQPGAVAQTEPINPTAEMPLLFPPQRLNLGFVLGILLAILLYIFLFKTAKGYGVRANGLNMIATRFAGINNKTVLLVSMLASGGFAGLLGAERTLGVYNRFMQGFSPGYGFTAIAVAVLGKNNPIAIIPAAILFGALESGADTMALYVDVPRELGFILQALIIVVVSSSQFIFRNRKGVKSLG